MNNNESIFYKGYYLRPVRAQADAAMFSRIVEWALILDDIVVQRGSKRELMAAARSITPSELRKILNTRPSK